MKYLLILTFFLPTFLCAEAILYWSPLSSCSWRVRLALEYKEIPYRLVQPDVKGELYMQLNSQGKVPTLAIDGLLLTQSGAILEYLEETRPKPSLLPSDAGERAKVRQIMGIIGSDIQPLQNGAILHYLPNEMRSTWTKQHIEKGFEALEKLLKESSGYYSVGNQITFADLFLLPQLRNANRYEVLLHGYPAIERIGQNVQVRFGRLFD